MFRVPPGAAPLLVLVLASALRAQVSGFVENIGFDKQYRPDCWTPMLVTITSQSSKPESYQVHVKLQDMDRDLPIFTRTITVTGAAENQSRQQKFWVYFLPPPTDGGLPDARDAGMTAKDLAERLKVSLYTTGGKWVSDLSLEFTITNIEPRAEFSRKRGTKFILAVADSHAPIYQDNRSDLLLGVMEDVALVRVRPGELPENVLGYDAVDAIIWTDPDPATLKAGGDERFRALEAWVRRGGNLVICQPAEWQKTLGFEDLLPVTIQGVEQKQDLMPLRGMAMPKFSPPPGAQDLPPQQSDPWAMVKPPFRLARATAKPGALVDQWIAWSKPGDLTPFLVRMPLGMGSVTWVAQDLGDPALTGKTRSGWANVWDRVFDWKNQPLPVMEGGTYKTPDSLRRPYEPGLAVDIGRTLLNGMDLQSKSAWLITLAVVFFIGYWLVAGPGMYTFLAARHRTQASWFLFGAAALAATGLTALIVKLVLRGPPELRHFSVVRIAPDQPEQVLSRFGLYIPRDGMQTIALRDVAPATVTTISALPIHPAYLNNAPEQTGPEYFVPVVDAASDQAASIRVPYRSTLKKFEATWVGEAGGGAVTGNVRLLENGGLEGSLTNATGQALRNIYVAYKYPGTGLNAGDWLFYLPTWQSGVTMDMARELGGSSRSPIPFLNPDAGIAPDRGRPVRGRIIQEWWNLYWRRGMGGNALVDTFDDTGQAVRRTLAMMSLFDRLPPARNEEGVNPNRFELLRRGGRNLDISAALAAGAMVVLAEADGPLPFPMDVEGQRVTGDGKILYQFVIPLDHGKLDMPSTQEAE